MGCSLIWRSISKARELLKQGHRWLVGSCEQILDKRQQNQRYSQHLYKNEDDDAVSNVESPSSSEGQVFQLEIMPQYCSHYGEYEQTNKGAMQNRGGDRLSSHLCVPLSKTNMGIWWTAESRWKPTLEGEYRVGVDGAFKGNKAGIGVVIMDHVGEVVATMAANLQGVVEAAQTEKLAIWNGIQLAKDLLLYRFPIESDCATVIEEFLQGLDKDLEYVEPVNFVVQPEGFSRNVEKSKMRDWAFENEEEKEEEAEGELQWRFSEGGRRGNGGDLAKLDRNPQTMDGNGAERPGFKGYAKVAIAVILSVDGTHEDENTTMKKNQTT
ncbi:hypothetical protein M9H77_12933 [Catharanthus roseus]|uniref:Uncharacterized protein n=1 Tax=Catharanthus roseus TaxID=4058 RepID=A0ACC0BIY3_CATRO|nr:hypothetical protein M9H77_12933 [Catharanthus roseus]